MKALSKYPKWVPEDVVEYYVAWTEKTAPFALPDNAAFSNREPDNTDANVKTSYEIAFDCLEHLMLSRTMKNAWSTIGKRARNKKSSIFAEETVSLISAFISPHPLGTVDQATALRKSAEKLGHALKLVKVNIDLDSEFLGGGSVKHSDGTVEILIQSDLKDWFKITPEKAIENFVIWLQQLADNNISYLKMGTNQPSSRRALFQRLIAGLTNLMYELYERPLDDAVASFAEAVLAFFGFSEAISRERVMQLRKSLAAAKSAP